MPVRIDRIALDHLGPLGEREFQLKTLNLIYGQNETGKTFLVEFLLRSLFRNARDWSLRELPGNGLVAVSGLAEEPIEFRPNSDIKLEDYWAEAEAGLPTNMARLLVVKGGELSMDQQSPGGVGRAVLKTVLSREALLEQILDPILKTTREARVEGGEIVGDHRGELSRRSDLVDHLRRLDNLFEQVERRYSQGSARSLELKRGSIEEQLERQRLAKRHLAYQLEQQRDALEEQRKQLPDEPLETLHADLRDYEALGGELERLESQLKAKEEAAKEYPWLAQAVGLWERRGLETAVAPSPLLLVGTGLGLILGLAFALLDLPAAAVGLFVVGLTLGGFYLWQWNHRLSEVGDAEERAAIRQGFEERFGEPMGGLAALRARHEELREVHSQARMAQERVEESRDRRTELSNGIVGQLKALTGRKIGEEKWGPTVEDLRRKARSLDERSQRLALRLTRLGVDPADRRAEGVATDFDPDRLAELEGERDRNEGKLQAARQDLEGLKQMVCNETGDDIGAPWHEVLGNLRERRAKVESDYRHLTAEILAKIGVCHVLDEIRAHEDDQIREGLRRPEVLDLLELVTGRRRKLDLVEDRIMVSGVEGEFALNALSTGAREQVQLALRMGFASHLAGGQPLFLLLDDAFQHSDWERRERLVDRVILMVESGWQVTYLTMDDHLRDLFRGAGERTFGDAFCYEEF